MERKEYEKWSDELKAERLRIKEMNPHWSIDKCDFLARQNIPVPKTEGWK